MKASCHAWWRDALTVCCFLLSACGSPENDAALLSIDPTPLQEHIAQQLTAKPIPNTVPIVLVHGMAGFAPVGRFDYFYHVPKAARDAGFNVFVAHTDPFQGTAYRARQLATEVDTVLQLTGAERVHLIAHSQGGLDARYLISTLGYGDRVATLTTVGTPHQGVRLVDVALRFAPNHLMEPLSRIMDALGNALLGGHADFMAQLHDLGAGYVQGTFNPQNEDDPRVEYFSYAGYTQTHHGGKDLDVVTPLLVATYRLTRLCEGDNDGLVSNTSARWGTYLGMLPADHWDEIGQLPTAEHAAFAHLPFYLQLMKALESSGTPPLF